MADDVDQESKTEDATPRRREEARKQGQVPFSAELVGGVVLLAGIVGLMNFGPAIADAWTTAFRDDLSRIPWKDLDELRAQELMISAVVRMLGVLAPFFGLLLAVGVGASMVQVGFQLSTEKLEPNLERLDPSSGVMKLFSPAAVVKGFLALLKVAALATVAAVILRDRVGIIAMLDRDSVPGATAAAWDLAMRLALYLSGAVALVGIIDYIYQRRRFENSLKMTKQELKEELKQEDGDPLIKNRIRQLQKERSRRKMLAQVPKATVVVTNPTHVAIALRYDTATDSSPVVVARGYGFMAMKIAELARTHSVPVLERPILARAIYATVKEGQPIPGDLFRAVAEVIAFVYRLRGIAPQHE